MYKKREFDLNGMLGKIIDNETKKTYNNDDENLYKPNAKANGGNYSSIIRFLPPTEGEPLPFVKRFSHGWEDVGGWFINNCPSTLGEDCPVCKENGRIWKSQESIARPRSRKASFYTNILVIKDKQNPELEGKVLKYRYGVKIHEKIMAKLNPEDEDFEPKVIVFDYETGANFKLIIKTIDSSGKKFLNYDSSEFATPGPIGEGKTPYTDEQIGEVDSRLFPLQPLIAKSEFKSYEFLANEFIKRTGIVIGTDPSALPQAKTAEAPVAPKVEQVVVSDDISFDNTSSDVDLSSEKAPAQAAATTESETAKSDAADKDYFDDM
jgi:hypothetical protein